jgi:SAM-dependent methyltransferase
VIGKLARTLRTRGITGLLRAAEFRLRESMAIPARSYRALESFFRGKKGIEIGGPSRVFARRNVFPVYPIAG